MKKNEDLIDGFNNCNRIERLAHGANFKCTECGETFTLWEVEVNNNFEVEVNCPVCNKHISSEAIWDINRYFKQED